MSRLFSSLHVTHVLEPIEQYMHHDATKVLFYTVQV